MGGVLAVSDIGPNIVRVRRMAVDPILGVVMAEPKMTGAFPNRRLERRHPLPSDAGAALYFRYPSPNGPSLEVRLRDVSLSGLSMLLPEELAGIQAGDIVKGIEARVARKTFRGDLLVMHVTPANQVGAICGGLFYPEGDEDLITIRLVVRALEAASKE
jgi:hypothetical protein